MENDYVSTLDPVNNSGISIVNTLTGLLGKGVDVAIDRYALKNTPAKIGTVYPSGDKPPGAVQNEKTQEAIQKTQDGTYGKYALWVVGGIAVLGLVYFIAKKA